MDNKVKSPFRRILSLLLCISMVLTCSVSVNAADVVQAVNELTTTAADEASTEAAETDGLTDSEETDETTIPAETDESTTSAEAKETTGSANTETTAETAATEKTTGAAVTEKETKATESENTTEAAVMSVNEDEGIDAQADDTIYILAGGDYQEAGDHTASSENVTNILNAIYSAGYTTMDGFLFIGDYDCETHNDATETAKGIDSLMSTVQAKYSNINHDNAVLAQGNHDYADSRIDATGGHDFTGYSAYVLNEDDYVNGGGTESGVKALAANLETWLNEKIEADFDDPIFIVSHLPLAFGPRTNVQGDAKYAKYLFDVLNAGGEAGLNIIFLHGHNHAYGYDNYLGGEAIYLPKGDKINIAEVGSNSSYTTETLNFTYMNAGYTGYYNESGYTTSNEGTDKLTMTVFAIADNKVTVGRYSADGAYNLKSAGRSTGDYISEVSVTANTDTYKTTQTIELTAPAEKVTLSNETTGVSVNGAKTEGTFDDDEDLTVKKVAEVTALSDTTKYSAYQAYDLTFTANGTVTVTLPVPTEYPLDNTKVYYVDGNVLTDMNATITMVGGNKVAQFETTHNSTYAVVYEVETASEETTSTYYKRVESVTDLKDGEYLIVFDCSSQTEDDRYVIPTIATYSSGSSQRKGPDVVDADRISENNKIYVTDTLESYEWTLTKSGSGWLIGNGSQNIAVSYNSTSSNYEWIFSNTGDVFTIASGMSNSPSDADSYSFGIYNDDSSAVSWQYNTTATLIYGKTSDTYTSRFVFYQKVTETTSEEVPETSVNNWIDISGTYYKYELDIDGIDYNTNSTGANNRYIIVASDTDVALGADPTTVVEVSPVDNTILLDSRDNEYHFLYLRNNTSYYNTSYYICNGSGNYLYHGNYILSLNTNRNNRAWTSSTHNGNGLYTLLGSDNNGQWKMYYSSSNGDFRVQTADSGVRLYKYTGTQTNTGYAKIVGDTLYQFNVGEATADEALATVKAGITGYTSTSNSDSGMTELDDSDLTWTWVDTYDSSTAGYYTVQISYEGKVLGTVEVQIVKKIVSSFSLTSNVGYVNQYASATAQVKDADGNVIYVTTHYTDGTTSKAPLTVAMLSAPETKVAGVKNNQTVTYGSYEITSKFTLNVIEKVVDNYPDYPDEGAVKVNKTGTGIDFQSSGIAQVELSASGVPSKKGADVIVMLDTSSSMESWCVECNAKFSSSTCNHDNQTSTYSRAAVLEESLKDLIAQFKTPGDDGELLDIRVAIADFNGFYGEKQSKSGTAYDRDAADMMADDIHYNASSEAQVYTGDGSLGAGAFVDAADLKTTYTLNYTSGTNYDYAFDAIYQMGTAIKAANGDEERDLYVIFMSDGAAMQWNYYHSQGASSLWNSWITGVWSENDLTSTNLNCTEHKYYYNTVDTNGDGRLNEHRMANAIKGDTDSTYEVIRKTSDLGTAVDGYNDLYMVPGLGATMFSIAFDPVADDQVTAASMETSIATIASEQADSDTTQYYYRVEDADALSSAFNTIGSEIAYAAYNARFVDTMGEDYDIQLEPVNYKSEGSKKYDTTITPTIEVKSYTIWTRAEYEAGNCTENQIGQRKTDSNGNYIYTVLETVTFTSTSTVNEDGQTIYTLTGAYSDQVDSGETNILADGNDNSYVAGVIYAKNFLYNTNTEAVTVNGITIAGETFYWKLGTITTSELALSYYVYLTGSMEGEREAGSYPTNESAVLYYDNYLGNACEKATVSPVLAWKSANVSYAFYLVNAQGQPVNMDGTVVTFANRVTIVNPTLYDEVLLNSGDNVQSLEVASSGVLPSGYALYDYSAKYTVTINSNSTGSWEIVVGTDEDSNELTHTTYVTDYSDTEQYTNETSVEDVDHDYTHTTVWFAVVWEPQALPDTVVIDYGLPVDIHVMTNDMFGSFGKLIGVAKGEVTNSDNDNSTNEVTDTKVAGKYGTAEVIVPKTGANESNSVIRYTPSKMEMNGYDVFTYSVNYNNTELTNNNGYYYNTVTVIPATTIYYEDSFLEYTGYTWDNTQNGWVENTEKKFWTKVTDSTYNENTVITQDEDRPDDVKYAFDTIIDANNVYGYDSAYTECSQYSLGSAMKATVDYDNYAEASFKFYGTGFDVISLTSNATGTIYVDVYALDGDGNRADKATANYIVDTYYGYISSYYEVTYTYGENGWTVYSETKVDALGSSDTVPESPAVGDSYTVYETRWETVTHSLNALYQVPVMQVEDLDYGHYEAVIKALYEPAFDHVDSSASDGSYDFYLDAIRIYDPANDGASDGTDDVTIENAYSADNESYPIYKELRNLIIDANSFGSDVTVTKEKASATTAVNGVVFIDSNSSVGNAQISDYVSYGPNNELYLAPGQAIAFKINDVFVDSEGNSITPVDVQLGIKSVGGSASIEMFNPGIKVTTTTEEITTTTTSTATKDNLISKNLDTATDMYYSIKALINGTIVISNPATSGTISITNLKFTFAKKATVKTETTPNEETGEEETNEASVASISEEGVVFSLRSLSAYSVSETVENAPEVFEPETFEVSVNKTSVKVGQKVKVTVTTSDDVAYITINGDVINNYKNNKKTGLRTWTVQLDATEVGELDIEVVAFSDEDIASEPIAKQITVNAKNSGKKK